MSKPEQRPSGSRGRGTGRSSRACRRRRRPALEALEPYVLMAVNVIDVRTNADSGAGSLRAAITAANGTAGPSEIDFQIPGNGPVTIMVGSSTSGAALPTIVGTLFINGDSEKVFQHSQESGGGDVPPAGPPLVVIDGTDAPVTDGLHLSPGDTPDKSSQGSVIRGLVIVNFSTNSNAENEGAAIFIDAFSTDNVVAGNYLGVAADGTTAAPNGYAGVLDFSPGNTIGGTTAADRNVISGNVQAGVVVLGTLFITPVPVNNVIEGNYIGTNAAGTAAVPNKNGVVLSGTKLVTVGGTSAAAGNLISGNTTDGILVEGDGYTYVPDVVTSDNVIDGNFIGTNAAGTSALGNGLWGIDNEDADHTRIGGVAPTPGVAPGNLISGNGNAIGGGSGGGDVGKPSGGIQLLSSGFSAASPTFGSTIQGNLIGTDSTGKNAIPNAEGVVLAGAGGVLPPGGNGVVVSPNTVGGTATGDRNVISGNRGSGVDIVGTNAVDDVVQGNDIGVDITGDAPLGNFGRGVYVGDVSPLLNPNHYFPPLTGVATGATIGGSVAGAANVIVANQEDGEDGVALTGNSTTPTTGDVVQGNLIGVYANLTGSRASGNEDDGVHALYATGALILNNSIANNTREGVVLQFTSTSSVIGNAIYTNGDRGVSIEGTSQDDTISKNVIANNAASGVAFAADAGALTTANGNLFSQNSIFANKGIGITFNGDTNVPTPNTPGVHASGPNLLQNFPALLTSSIVNGAVIVHGTLGSLPDGTYTVEFFSNPAADPSGHGQGQTYLTSAPVAVTNGLGTFDVNVGRPTGAFLTATATDSHNNTSEFSASLQVALPSPAQSMTALSSTPNPSTLGQTVDFSVTVSPGATKPSGDAITAAALPIPTGMVTLLEGMQPLGSGTLDAGGHVTIPVGSLPIGTQTIDAVYLGDANYVVSSSNLVNQVVNPAASRTVLISAPNPSAFGAAVTFTATVTGTTSTKPTGTVTFLEGMFPLGTATLDASGHASLKAVPLSVGSNTIYALYHGDPNDALSTSPTINQVVNPAPSLTALTSAPNPSTFGQAVTITATVTPAGVQPGIHKASVAKGKGKAAASGPVPTGTVTFLEGMFPLGTATLDASGHATLKAVPLSVGSNTIYALYHGDATYTGSNSTTINQVVNPAKSTTAVVASSHVVTSGKPLSLTATVASQHGVTPTGTVTFLNGKVRLGASALDASGRATLTVASLSVGTHTITAAYGGDGNFAPSTSTVASVVVNPATGDGPRVTGLVRYGFHAQPTIFVIAFNGPLDPARAQNPLNYTLVGPVGGLGRGGQPIAIAQAIYDPSANTVTLLPARALNVHYLFKLTIHGTGLLGVTGAAGVPLDGASTGRPGSDYVTIFGRAILVGPASAYQVPPPVILPIRTPTAAAVDSLRTRGSLRVSKHLTWG